MVIRDLRTEAARAVEGSTRLEDRGVDDKIGERMRNQSIAKALLIECERVERRFDKKARETRDTRSWAFAV